MKYLKISLILLIFAFALWRRIPYLYTVSKDVGAYERAVTEFLTGTNPYIWAIESFSNPKDPSNHGYAYLPGFLYLYSFLYIIHLVTSFSYTVLWKIPLLFADFGVGLLLIKHLYKKNFVATLFALLMWFFNPYVYFRRGYLSMDVMTIFLLLLALWFLEKDDVAAGAAYALSIIFKTYPVIFLPLFLIKSKDKRNFILAGAIVGLFFSFPFMKTLSDFLTYIRGAVLIHGDRFIQGRPFLFYISYFYKIELFQLISFKFYSLASIFGAWVLTLVLHYFRKIRETYVLAAASFLNFYIFTPVLNRSYLMWCLPVLILALSKRSKPIYYASLIVYFVFTSWYLVQWENGFEVWKP